MSQELAKRAIACRHWRWMPGMRWRGTLSQNTGRLGEVFRTVPGPVGAYLPDLTDPATLGCLLSLVREAAQEPGLHVRCMLPYAPDMSGKTPPPWVLYSGRGQRWGDRHETEAEALVAALEAAP